MGRFLVTGRSVVLGALIGLVALGAGVAGAAVITTGCDTDGDSACSLEEMLRGGTITVGDKLFDNWAFDDLSTVSVSTTGISVVPLDDQPLNPGLRFVANGNLSVTNLDEIFFQLDYAVSTVDGVARINGSTLELGTSSVGQGLIALYADLFDAGLADIGHNEVNAGPIGEQLFDQASFAPQSRLSVQAFVILAGGAAGDSVGLDSFTQRFSQVSEPGTLLLLTVALLGLRHRRRSFQPMLGKSPTPLGGST